MPNTPLAVALRPITTADIIGQDHLLNDKGVLGRMLKSKIYRSTILWGPPGVGKTSIVRAIAKESGNHFEQLNATNATVKDIRKIIDTAKKDQNKITFVFVDEVHRFSKSQQDVLLPSVEDGTITLFGATTEKPKFAVNSTILSRCLVCELKPLDKTAMLRIILKIKNYYKEKGRTIKSESSVLMNLINKCSGDARKLISVIETVVEILSDNDTITEEHVMSAMPDKHMVFDASGNEHFDFAHAYQESIQHSDVDGAIYWLASWIESGEDPAYICRRMLITAFEDCAGNPHAAMLAMAAHYTTERTGLPECVIPMSLATCEMAMSKRNKSAYHAIQSAISDVRNKEVIRIHPGLRAGTQGYVKTILKKYLNGWVKDDESEPED